ncbi:MAG: SprB repeat-containing protein, partial [Ginsengibacter sp.]
MKKILLNQKCTNTVKNFEKNFLINSLISFLFISFMIISLSANAGNKITVNVVKKSYNGSDISCSSSADAQLTVTASGGNAPYQYSISNGSSYQSGNVFSNLAGGQNYVVVVKDSKGNTSDATWIYVNQAPSPITITGIQKKYYYNGNNDVSCSSASDGQISISAWGGTGSLQYSADNGTTFQSSNVISGFSAGTYQVVVKDANGCTGTSSVTLRAPSPVSGTIVAQTPTLCSGTNSGTATIAGSGGVGLYYYSIDGSAFQWSGAFTNLAAGSHPVLIRDNNGCMGSLTVTITSALSAVLTGDAIILPGHSANLSVVIAGTVGTKYTVVYKDSDGKQYTANNLVTGLNLINTGNL